MGRADMASNPVKMDGMRHRRIIGAAMSEFASRGYEDANTDRIARNAGVSKGLVFHYFGTKRELFLSVFDHAMEVCRTQYLDLIDLTQTDLFARVRRNTLLKIKLIPENPGLFNFIAAASLGDADGLKDEIEKRKAEFMKSARATFMSGIDCSLFKDGVDPNHAIDIIVWTVEGHATRAMARHKDRKANDLDLSGYMEELEAYLGLLRQVFYK